MNKDIPAGSSDNITFVCIEIKHEEKWVPKNMHMNQAFSVTWAGRKERWAYPYV